MNFKILAVLLLVAALFAGCIGEKTTQVPVKKIDIKGSDTELQMFAALAEEFMRGNPDITVTVTGGGSGVGIAALINREIGIATSSRPMKKEEIEKARVNGVEPWEFVVARDGLSVIIHPENPVTKLTFEQVSKIYRGEITSWKDVGGRDESITLYGRQSASGTYIFFRDTVVKGDYSPKMRNMESTSAIIDAVSKDKTGVGYIGIGYMKPSVKAVDIAKDAASEYVTPLKKENIESGKYPITRPLFMYAAGKPSKDSPTHLLLKFILSTEGQKIVKESGFYPANPEDNANNQEKFAQIER